MVDYDIGRDSTVGFDEAASGSNLTPRSPAGPSPIEADRKRKLAVPSKVPAKKPNVSSSLGAIDQDSVANSPSTLTNQDVIRLFENANISFTDYQVLIPSKNQRANKPPQGYISVYAEQINAGLRFPLHDMVVRVCRLIKVSPSQLVPNAHRMIVGFIICAMFYKIPLTEDTFFSLFHVTSAAVKGLFQFSPIQGRKFLDYQPSSYGSWKKKFFFLRPKGNNWNCITKWSGTYFRPMLDTFLGEVAIGKGILNHHFRVNELSTRKEILVHGGIEPGVPSTKYTFRYLMHKAAVDKFELLPEDFPLAEDTKTPFTATTVAHSNPLTSTACASSLAQPRSKPPINHERPLSGPSHTKIPYSTDIPICKVVRVDDDDSEDDIPLSSRLKKNVKAMKSIAQPSDKKPVNKEQPLSSPSHSKFPCFTDKHIRKDLPVTSTDCIPPSDRVCRMTEGQATKSTLSMSDETGPILAAWQTIESAYVPRECYHKLEKDVQNITSELALTKSLVQELEQKLDLSESKRAESETKTSWAMEVLENMKKRIENPPTLLASAASLDQPSGEHPVKHQPSLSTPTHTEIPSATLESISVSSEDNIPLNNHFGKENQNQECGSCEVRVETNSTVTKSDEAKHQSIPIELQTIIESSYVARDHHHKLEKDHQKVSSELAYAKSRIEELELSDAKRADSEYKSFLANEAMKKLERINRIYTNSRIQELERELDISKADIEKSNYLAIEAMEKLEKMKEGNKSRDSELAHAKSRIQELETKLEASEAKRTELENMNNLTNDAMKNLDKMVEHIKSDSDRSREKIVKGATEADRVLKKGLEDLNSELERCRDQIAKDAIQAFKFSDEFLNASIYSMDAFDVNFLNIPTDECNKSSGASR